MKKYIALFILLWMNTSLFSQQQHIQNLEFVYQTVKKTPGYREQIKGDKRTAYDRFFVELKDMVIGPTTIDTFITFSRLLWPVKDNHLWISQTWNPASSNVSLFQSAPIDLDSLENALSKKPLDSVEGIYHSAHGAKIGIYRTKQRERLIGVILAPSSPAASRGDFFGLFWQMQGNALRAVYADRPSKSIFYVRHTKFSHGRFHDARLRKTGGATYSEFWSQEPYLFRCLNPEIKYLYLGNFKTSNDNMRHATAFYNRIKDSLNSAYLIVDIRGNLGGGERCSNQFLKLIKGYAKKGKVYVLINEFTVSSGERFALALKGGKNVILCGETTNGTIAYGKNFGGSAVSSDGRLNIWDTDMKDPANYLQYEELGVNPDVFLDHRKEWLGQLMEIISVR